MRFQPPRLPRAGMLGILAVALGLWAHGAAGGAMPVGAQVPLLLGVGLGAAAVTALADLVGGLRRTAGALATFVALGAGQVVLHLAASDDDGGHAMAGMDPVAHLLSPPMLTAHLLVTLAVTAGIAGVEATAAVVVTLWRALAELTRRVRLPSLAPVPARSPLRVVLVAGRPARGAHEVRGVRIHPLRGPPLPS